MPIFAGFFEKRTSKYTLAAGIAVILSLISYNQMFRTHALRSVAPVQYIIWPPSGLQEQCYMVRIKAVSFVANSPVSGLCTISNPEPARIGFVNIFPEGVGKISHTMETISFQGSVVNLTPVAPCNEALWQHVYNPKRLHVKQACISVSGTFVDATNGRQVDGCRHEADGDAHCWLKLDKGEEGLLVDGNIVHQQSNLVFEPICRYKVTQSDALMACSAYTPAGSFTSWQQKLELPPIGSHVRITGAYVYDAQHKHTEIHPITSVVLIGQ